MRKKSAKKTAKKVISKPKTTKAKDTDSLPLKQKPLSKKITQSISNLGRELAHIAYQSAMNSGDYYSYKDGEGGSMSDLWADYWEKNYKYLFFAAVYALEDDLQKHSEIRSAVNLARNDFFKALKREEKECFMSYKKNIKVSTDSRLAKLRYFNGSKETQLPRPTSFKVMEKQISKDRWFSK